VEPTLNAQCGVCLQKIFCADKSDFSRLLVGRRFANPIVSDEFDHTGMNGCGETD